MERAARRTSPVPAQVPQLVALEPGAAPVPPHAVQRSSVRTFTFLVVPLATSARLSFSVTLRSWPRWCSRRARSEPPKRSEEHTSELQSQSNLVCRLLLEKKKKTKKDKHVL